MWQPALDEPATSWATNGIHFLNFQDGTLWLQRSGCKDTGMRRTPDGKFFVDDLEMKVHISDNKATVRFATPIGTHQELNEALLEVGAIVPQPAAARAYYMILSAKGVENPGCVLLLASDALLRPHAALVTLVQRALGLPVQVAWLHLTTLDDLISSAEKNGTPVVSVSGSSIRYTLACSEIAGEALGEGYILQIVRADPRILNSPELSLRKRLRQARKLLQDEISEFEKKDLALKERREELDRLLQRVSGTLAPFDDDDKKDISDV